MSIKKTSATSISESRYPENTLFYFGYRKLRTSEETAICKANKWTIDDIKENASYMLAHIYGDLSLMSVSQIVRVSGQSGFVIPVNGKFGKLKAGQAKTVREDMQKRYPELTKKHGFEQVYVIVGRNVGAKIDAELTVDDKIYIVKTEYIDIWDMVFASMDDEEMRVKLPVLYASIVKK